MPTGLTHVTLKALSLEETAGAFPGRQLTLTIIALTGAISGPISGQRLLLMIGGFGLFFINGHNAIFMGLMGAPASAAIGGLVFAPVAAIAIFLVWRTKASQPIDQHPRD